MNTLYRFYVNLLHTLAVDGAVTVSTNLTSGEKTLGVREGWYQETLSGKPWAVLCGGGHVAAALAPLLHALDWRVTVQDDRAEFVTAERFSTAAELICAPFSTLADRAFPAGTYFIIMTRGHQDDYACLSALLCKDYGYLGMIGSRSKVALTQKRLREDGSSEETIASVHTPIGLRIGAETPMEIAVSIAAEIIQEFRANPRNFLEEHIVQGIREQNRPLVLATVVKKLGSSPRGAGTRMLVNADGGIIGTIGGGAVEAAVIRDASALCGGDQSRVVEYDLSNSQAATLGMICGGHIRVLLEPLNL